MQSNTQRVAAVRRFSRFYTRVIGVLAEGLLHTRFTLTEARVLYELAQADEVTAAGLGRDLDLDAGYLSRILQRFERDAFLARRPSPADRRQTLLALTEAGEAAFAPLDARSREAVAALLAKLPEPAQDCLVTAMQRIETLLGGTGSSMASTGLTSSWRRSRGGSDLLRKSLAS